MFRIMDMLDYLESQFTFEFVPNSWKAHSADTSVAVLMNGGTGGFQTSSPNIQFLIRAARESESESMAYDLFEFFDYKTNFSIGDTQVVLSRGEQAAPLYTGKDNNERHVYSVNLIFTVSNY